jgi:hypothetical protein
MGKLFNLLLIFGVLYFIYWRIKAHFHHKKLEAQGIVLEQKGIRPITLFSIVMLVCYGGYMLYFFLSK